MSLRAKDTWQKELCIKQILSAWKENPDLRLGQLIMNAIDPKGPDLFYLEDMDLATVVMNYGKKK